MPGLKKGYNLMQWVLIVLYLVLTVSGLVLFKKGSNQGLAANINHGFLLLKINWESMLGILCYGCSFLLYLTLVSKMDLGYIYPLTTGIIYILVLVASVVIFKEAVSTFKIIGCGLIFIGVILINIQK
jgi:small multidrug resistance pump